MERKDGLGLHHVSHVATPGAPHESSELHTHTATCHRQSAPPCQPSIAVNIASSLGAGSLPTGLHGHPPHVPLSARCVECLRYGLHCPRARGAQHRSPSPFGGPRLAQSGSCASGCASHHTTRWAWTRQLRSARFAAPQARPPRHQSASLCAQAQRLPRNRALLRCFLRWKEQPDTPGA
jgi:hypothetical protein